METQGRSDKDHRKQISKQEIGDAVALVRYHLFRRLDHKGYGAWLSRHEILGMITEEFGEPYGIHLGTKCPKGR